LGNLQSIEEAALLALCQIFGNQIGGSGSGASDSGGRHAGLLGGDDHDDHDDPDNDGSFDDDTDVAGDVDGGDTEEV